ncbi:hypothetical protein [Chelatococcus reniformis]|uniref:Uncharacterized protein n=1 Tax=Chelatococcus reniformis TaxID=1494448 RepID=A0A916TW02_9HYPH|nr:hypothetical protein [Chelatococcus reniformis]GGC45134.1 hypothetical protein GCM10010994_00350 [Chelatococcus reniformis]
MATIESIRGGAAPSPHADLGPSVIRAIAGYAGQPTPLKRDGAAVTAWPLTDGVRFTVAPPGAVPLDNRLFALVDVPDLRALAELWPATRTIWMGAAPVPENLYRLLMAGAWAVRLGLLPTLKPRGGARRLRHASPALGRAPRRHVRRG